MTPARVMILAVIIGAAAGTAAAATVQLRGLRSIDEAEILGALEGRLTYVKARPASPSRADDAAFLLEELLRKRGFTEPRVEWSISGADTIVLTVTEGPQSSLGAIKVRGVDEPLAKELEAQVRAGFAGGVRRQSTVVPYLESRREAGFAKARNLLHSRGFWQAEVTLASTRRDPRSGATDLDITVAKGPLYRLLVPKVEVDGIAPAPPEDPFLDLSGLPSTTGNLNRARNIVARFYRREGYQFAEIDVLTDHRDERTRLTLVVRPGRRYRVGDVRVEGATDISPERITNRFREFPGETYNANETEREVRRLLDTGAFESIRLEESPRPGTGLIDLTLHVREGDPDGYHAYAGLGSFEGPFLGGGYYHNNVFDRLWSFTAGLEISALGLLGEVSLTDPWFLETDLRFTTRGFVLARQFDGYQKLETGGGVQLAWNPSRHYSLITHFTSSYVGLSSDGIPAAELGPDAYFLNVLGLRQRYDRRNDKTLPTNGWFAQLDTDLGLALGDDSVSFFRSIGHISIYQPVIGDTSHVAVGLRSGIIIPSGSTTDLPIDLRLFNGGANTVRSYRERDLGPRATNGDPRGGESYWIANVEYIHTIAGLARGVVFLDAGTLNEDHSDLFGGTVHYAAGLGVRLDLPIGPLRLEYGHNLSPDKGGPSGTWHFTIGTTF